MSSERFHQQLEHFLVALKKILPEEKSISIFQVQLSTARMLSDKLVIESFKKYVCPHKKEIMEEDEHFFLKDGNVDVHEDYLSESIHMKELWKSKLSEENKKVVWKYFKVLVILAEKCG